MSDTPLRKHRRVRAAVPFLMGLLIAGGAAAAESGARVTAVKGGANIDRSGSVGDDTAIETGSDGNAAMLVDERSLVELCGSTSMTLTRNSKTGGRVINVGAGTTRIVVEPRADGERIQIQTPAAIATILGTVVYVTVDPATGETTIASEDHDVRVDSADPNVQGSTTITGSQQVTIRPGEAPAAPRKIARRALANMGGCLANFHDLALAFDRAVSSGSVQDKIVMSELENPPALVIAPDVSAPPPDPIFDDPGTDTDLEDPADTILPFDAGKEEPPSSNSGGGEPPVEPEPDPNQGGPGGEIPL